MIRSLILALVLLLSTRLSQAETQKTPALVTSPETCLITLNEQVQSLRESRLAFQEALEKENRHLFDASIIDLDYALEVLDDAFLPNQRQRQAALIKGCNDATQIRSLLHLESMIALDRQVRCHRLVNIANSDYQAFSKNKSKEDFARYKKSLALAIKENACSAKVKERLQQSLKRVSK